MDITDALLYSSITGMVIACYIASIKYLYKCKFSNMTCCGISIQRNVQVEQDIEEGTLRRTSSGIPVMSQIFPTNRANI